MVRETKHTEIGDIPADWEIQTFEETFRILSNNTLSRENFNNRGGAVRNIHYGDILTQFTEVLDCSENEIPYVNDLSLLTASTQLLQDGDIVIADTAEDETVGKVTEVQGIGKDKLVAGLHTIPCRVKKGDFAPGWLGYYMNSNNYHNQIVPFITGIKVSSISKTSIAKTLILIPSLEEQKAITQILSEIDLLISAEIKVIDKIKAVKKGCLSKMFPKNGEFVPEIRLPEFAGDWEQRKLGELCDFINGDRSSNYPSSADFQENGIPFVGSDSLGMTLINKRKMRFITPEKYSNMNGLKIQKGDILYTLRGAGFGKCSISDFSEGTVASSLVGIRCKKELVVSKYLIQWLNSENAKNEKEKAVNGSTAQNISVEDMKSYLIKIPLLNEQEKIGEYFSNLDNLITFHKRKLEKYKSIKQGMMSDLLTGKIRLI